MEVVAEKYKQTEVGLIPSDWDVKRLVDVSEFSNGKAHEQSIDEDGDFVVVNSKFISTEGEIFKNSNQAISPLAKGDITLVMSDIPNGKALAKCYLIEIDNKYTLNQRICSIKTRVCDNVFLFYVLNRNKYFLSFDSGSGQTNLRRNEVLDCPLAIPPTIAEQTAISTALSNIDELIAQTEKLIVKKIAIKQGVMQELLKPKEGWSIKKLGDYGRTYGGITGKGKADFGKGTARYIPFMNIMSNSVIDINYLEKVNILAGEFQNKVQRGDLFFNGSSETPEELGLCSVLDSEVNNVFLNSFCFGYRFHKNDELNRYFLSYLFRSPLGRTLIFSLAQGSTRYNLSKINLLKLELLIPSKEEQDFIAKVFLDIDDDLKYQDKKLQKLKLQKQGMMQALLTGKIRLI